MKKIISTHTSTVNDGSEAYGLEQLVTEALGLQQLRVSRVCFGDLRQAF